MTRSLSNIVATVALTLIGGLSISLMVIAWKMSESQNTINHIVEATSTWNDYTRIYEVNTISTLASLQTFLVDHDQQELEEAAESLTAIDETLPKMAAFEQSQFFALANIQQEVQTYQAKRLALRDAMYTTLTYLQEHNTLEGDDHDATFNAIEELEDQALSLNDLYVQLRSQELSKQSQDIDSFYRQTLWIVGILFALLTVLAIFCWVGVYRGLIRPLSSISLATEAIGSGKFTTRLETDGVADLRLLKQRVNQTAALLGSREQSLNEQVHIAEQAQAVTDAAKQQLAKQLATITEQQTILREISVPLIPIHASTLIMPLIGTLDAQRLELIRTQALAGLEKQNARTLIMDVTGVPIIDSHIAQGTFRGSSMAGWNTP
jgi:rsbT co-antagonist protein RsbR